MVTLIHSTHRLFAVASVGLALCWYSYYVEVKHQFTNNGEDMEAGGYIALCDISAHSSCSRAFLSHWGHILSALHIVPKGHALDLPNPLIGSVYYLFILLQSYVPFETQQVRARLIFALSLIAIGCSAILAYELIFVQHNFCIICFSVYVCNIVILHQSFKASQLLPKRKGS